MLPVDIDAILRVWGSRRAKYRYQKDEYALRVLLHVIGGGRPICDLRRGPFARLLQKPALQRVLARAAGGVLTPALLREALLPDSPEYQLTLARWGGAEPDDWSSPYYQTSRPGQNLVLQLNFPSAHDRAYQALVQPHGGHPFVQYCHPVRWYAPYTLAWARLDIDFDSDEVLIEEVQCDWVREALVFMRRAEAALQSGDPPHLPFHDELKASATQLLSYVERVLLPHARVWEECVLCAAVDFAYSRLGARVVYFHTYEGGLRMKRLSPRRGPPRSLYTELPERFCFSRTRVAPRILRDSPRLRDAPSEFFSLALL